MKSIQAGKEQGAKSGRDGSSSFCLDFDTPYRFVYIVEWHSNPVGAGLSGRRIAAIAVCQVTKMVTDTASSWASPLPTGIFSVAETGGQALLGIPYLRKRMAMALWEVCKRAASNRLDG